MNKHITLSIVSAAFNEEIGIKKTLESWYEYAKENKNLKNFEIIIVNDGSTDKTKFEINKLISKKKIKLINFRKNLGAAAAFNVAIKNTKYQYIMILDSDGQFPVKNFDYALKNIMLHNIDAIIGFRKKKKDNFYYRFGSKISGFFANLIYNSNIPDFNCAFKVVRGSLLRSLNLEAKGMNYSTEMTAKILEVTDNICSIKVLHNKTIKKRKIKKIIKDSLDRLLFLIYLLIRKFFLKINIIHHGKR